MEKVFRRLIDRKKVELVTYISEYLSTNEGIEILIGCDSQVFKTKTIYAIVIALYTPGKGAHLLFTRWNTNRENYAGNRLINEVWASIEVAEYLREAGIPKAKYIDVDLNPDPQFKSNEVFRQAVGMVEGMGYACRHKGTNAAVTYAADSLVKMY